MSYLIGKNAVTAVEHEDKPMEGDIPSGRDVLQRGRKTGRQNCHDSFGFHLFILSLTSLTRFRCRLGYHKSPRL